MALVRANLGDASTTSSGMGLHKGLLQAPPPTPRLGQIADRKPSFPGKVELILAARTM